MKRPTPEVYGSAEWRNLEKRHEAKASLPGITAVIFVVAVILPFAAQSIAAQSSADVRTDGALSGFARDASGDSVAHSTIVIRHDSSRLEDVIDGNADGTFVVRRLGAGRYIITASAPGFAVATLPVEAPHAEPLTLTVCPAPIVEQVTVVSASRQEELRRSIRRFVARNGFAGSAGAVRGTWRLSGSAARLDRA